MTNSGKVYNLCLMVETCFSPKKKTVFNFPTEINLYDDFGEYFPTFDFEPRNPNSINIAKNYQKLFTLLYLTLSDQHD